MALALTDYTSYATLRGLLGVAEEEITDAVFDTLAPSALMEVTLTLEELNVNIPTLFETAKNATPTRPAAQQRFYDIVQLYAAYIVAAWISIGAVEMFAPIKITDSKAEMDRKDDPYTSLRTALASSLTLWRARLRTALTALDSTQTLPDPIPQLLVGSSGIATDPVTGV